MTEICCVTTDATKKNMEVGNVNSTNKRAANWRKEDVATLLGLWEALSNKQGANNPTYKNDDSINHG